MEMENIIEFIKPELLILIPIIYLIGFAIKKSKIADNLIPILLGAVSIVLCGIWVFMTTEVSGLQEVMASIFTAISQGVLVAGASVYVNQIIKQFKKAKTEKQQQ